MTLSVREGGAVALRRQGMVTLPVPRNVRRTKGATLELFGLSTSDRLSSLPAPSVWLLPRNM